VNRTFKVFGKKTCPHCPKARAKVEYFVKRWKVDAPIIYYDIDIPEGMAEGAWYDVVETPTVVLEEGENTLKRWVKFPPRFGELKPMFNIADAGTDETVPEPA
jgi:thiol-disulfide isomerase/thioredoxin